MASRIEGLDRLQRKFERLPAKTIARISEAMRLAANDIVALMKNLCPEDSGALRDSINWTWGDAPKGAAIIARSKTIRNAGNNIEITIYAGNAEAFYARFVEFGTSSHTAGGKFAGATIPAIAANPFFYPGYRASRKQAKSRITRAINKAAKEVAAGGG